MRKYKNLFRIFTYKDRRDQAERRADIDAKYNELRELSNALRARGT